jgi:nucleotide-binding universal stress UspA family protein
MMVTRILVPTDFSPTADAALARARTLAVAFDASLHLLHVAENTFLRAKMADPHHLQLAATIQLNDRLPTDDRDPPRATAVMERSDHPADEIVRAARTRQIDLIAMGTHGRSGLAHFLIGSVAERVLRTAPCPVLTVRDAHLGGNPMFMRILVPVDFSEPSIAALEYARALGRKLGASLRVLHVVEDQYVTAPLGSDMYMAPSSAETELRVQEAKDQLASFLSRDDRTALRATADVITGSSARTITEYAGSNKFDLIVMGTHGRTGLAHFVMGSVAEKVIRTATCPVLTVRAAGLPSEAPIGREWARALA